MNPELSIVIPCYNEEKNIPLICQRINEVVDFDKYKVEIIFVNNGSYDSSAEVFQSKLKEYNNNAFKLVNIEQNQGYGFGILSGLKEANGEVLSWTHADLQTDFADVIRAFEEYKKYNDENIFVKGKRRERKKSEYILTLGMQIFASLLLRTYLDDINAQPKLFSRNFYLNHLKDNAPNDFSLDLYALYKAKKNGKIKEIPVYFYERKYGEAKGGGGSSFSTKLKIIKRTFKYIFTLSLDKSL